MSPACRSRVQRWGSPVSGWMLLASIFLSHACVPLASNLAGERVRQTWEVRRISARILPADPAPIGPIEELAASGWVEGAVASGNPAGQRENPTGWGGQLTLGKRGIIDATLSHRRAHATVRSFTDSDDLAPFLLRDHAFSTTFTMRVRLFNAASWGTNLEWGGSSQTFNWAERLEAHSVRTRYYKVGSETNSVADITEECARENNKLAPLLGLQAWWRVHPNRILALRVSVTGQWDVAATDAGSILCIGLFCPDYREVKTPDPYEFHGAVLVTAGLQQRIWGYLWLDATLWVAAVSEEPLTWPAGRLAVRLAY